MDQKIIKNRKNMNVIFAYVMTVFLFLILLEVAVLFLVLGIGNEAVIWYILAAVVAIFDIRLTFKIVNGWGESKRKAETLDKNYGRVQEELVNIGFNADRHFSSQEFEGSELKGIFLAPDNLHIEVDEKGGKIATYRLFPFDFKLRNMEDLIEVRVYDDVHIDSAHPENVLIKHIWIELLFADNGTFKISANDNDSFFINENKYAEITSQATFVKDYFDNLRSIART